MPNNKKKSKKKKYFLIIGGIVLLLILRSILFNTRNEAIIVQTEKVTKHNITQMVTAAGRINPVNRVIITPEVTGEIVTLPVKEGDTVKKGQLLIKIKPDLYIAQVERLKANLDSAHANLKMKKGELDFTRAECERMAQLFKAGMTNQQEMEKKTIRVIFRHGPIRFTEGGRFRGGSKPQRSQRKPEQNDDLFTNGWNRKRTQRRAG